MQVGKKMSVFESRGQPSYSLTRFPWHDGMLVREITPSISSVFPNNYSVPFILLGGKRYCENEVFCSGTQHNTRSGLEPRPLETKSSALPIGPSRPQVDKKYGRFKLKCHIGAAHYSFSTNLSLGLIKKWLLITKRINHRL